MQGERAWYAANSGLTPVDNYSLDDHKQAYFLSQGAATEFEFYSRFFGVWPPPDDSFYDFDLVRFFYFLNKAQATIADSYQSMAWVFFNVIDPH